MCGSNPKQFKHVKGYFISQATAIKQNVKVPVIGVGGITEPEHANALIQEEKVDLVAIGRALWQDNQWAQKALNKITNQK